MKSNPRSFVTSPSDCPSFTAAAVRYTPPTTRPFPTRFPVNPFTASVMTIPPYECPTMTTFCAWSHSAAHTPLKNCASSASVEGC